MANVLLTGGTGTLGRAVEQELGKRGDRVRVFSRRPRPADRDPDTWTQGDLRTGAGVAAAVEGVESIVHCATGRGDAAATHRLVSAAGAAAAIAPTTTPAHLVYISIVGVDRIPMFYYRAKLACEHLVADSGLPWTIVRATQFHDLVYRMVAAQRRLPVVLLPAVRFQPIDVRDVATVLADVVHTGAAGRAPNIGGPQVLSALDIGTTTLTALGYRRRVQTLRLPGRLFGALAAGENLVPGAAAAARTYAQFLAEQTGRAS
jgi:uncharacterized protein YbjT (DUF2867 family)